MPLKDLGSPAPNTGSLSVLLHAGAWDKPGVYWKPMFSPKSTAVGFGRSTPHPGAPLGLSYCINPRCCYDKEASQP